MIAADKYEQELNQDLLWKGSSNIQIQDLIIYIILYNIAIAGIFFVSYFLWLNLLIAILLIISEFKFLKYLLKEFITQIQSPPQYLITSTRIFELNIHLKKNEKISIEGFEIENGRQSLDIAYVKKVVFKKKSNYWDCKFFSGKSKKSFIMIFESITDIESIISILEEDFNFKLKRKTNKLIEFSID